ncbi:unnamed protein product [Orchesella dallaii]|uniref:C-Maf-inducing protein PH domain-containing protein n=1 Tax=Orchesella dallaii TaxID=48710 RepID=A0ABP1QBH7_9HEXA
MGQPEEELTQSPGKTCVSKSTTDRESSSSAKTCGENRDAQASSSNCCTIASGSSFSSSTRNSNDYTSARVGKLTSQGNDEGDEDKSGNELKEREESHGSSESHPRPRLSSESQDNVRNNSQESGLSSGDVSSSLSPSESFSGSEDISPKSSRREPLTTKISSSVLLAAGDCQQRIDVSESKKLDRKHKDYELVLRDEHDDDDDDDQHVHDNKARRRNSTSAIELVGIGTSIDCVRNSESSSTLRNSKMMKILLGNGEEAVVFGEGRPEGTSCYENSSSNPATITDDKKGNQNENIWMSPSLELSSSEGYDTEKQQNQQYRDRSSREKKRIFGLSGFGCKFNLNKIFSSSSRATHTHSTERLNNQLSTHSQGSTSLAISPTTLLSNVSKSSSESNILMCHNSLDNLTDDLPSSRSTDSSCLLPTATDDQVFYGHHHHQPDDDVLDSCCCCCCCCCRSNGTCDHHHLHHHRQKRKCECLHNSSNSASSSPASLERQRMSGNVDSREEENCSVEETNNNNHQVEELDCEQSRSTHFVSGNNSNLVERGSSPSNVPSSSSSTGDTVMMRVENGGETGEEVEAAACGSSTSHPNTNQNRGDAHVASASSRCNSRCGGDGSSNSSSAKASGPPNHSGNGMVLDPSCVNGYQPSLPSCSSSSSSTSSASATCSTGNSESSSSGSGCSTSSSFPNSSHGQKFKLLSDGDVQVCRVKHGKNLVDKVIGSKLLRRWETHHLYLNDACISSKTKGKDEARIDQHFLAFGITNSRHQKHLDQVQEAAVTCNECSTHTSQAIFS